MRTQGPEEPVRTYATCLKALMLHMDPTPTLELQLDMLHRNMKDKAAEGKPPTFLPMSCFGCGTPGVMRRDCPKCQRNDRLAR